MFAKLSVVAALALAPWAQALLLQLPVDWHSSSDVNITWTHTGTDAPFALQLFNTDEFHNTFSIANNLQPAADFTSFQLGVVPAGQYTLRAINQTNANQIYDETPSFTILDPVSTSASSSSTSAASGSSSGSASGSTTLVVSATSRASTSGFGVTVSNTNSAPGASGSGTANGSGTSSTGSPTPSSFNNGAAALPRVAPLAIAALGVVAGAAIAL